MTRTRITTLVAGVSTALALLTAGPAAADSIVYEKASNIWIANPDGSGQYQVTTDGTGVAPVQRPVPGRRRHDRGRPGPGDRPHAPERPGAGALQPAGDHRLGRPAHRRRAAGPVGEPRRLEGGVLLLPVRVSRGRLVRRAHGSPVLEHQRGHAGVPVRQAVPAQRVLVSEQPHPRLRRLQAARSTWTRPAAGTTTTSTGSTTWTSTSRPPTWATASCRAREIGWLLCATTARTCTCSSTP